MKEEQQNLNFKLPVRQIKRLDAVASIFGLSRGNLFRQIVDDWLESYVEETKPQINVNVGINTSTEPPPGSLLESKLKTFGHMLGGDFSSED